jgi:uncharacterized membrane protein YGL010W
MNADNPRQIDLLLDQYTESHQHPVNERLHIVCVPAIMASLLGLLWHAHPAAAIGLMAVSMIYYFRLSPSFACGMAVTLAATTLLLYCVPAQWLLPCSLTVFVVAWIGQFIGHKIEGKRPAFFDDLHFFLIGPLFVLRFLYRRLGIRY